MCFTCIRRNEMPVMGHMVGKKLVEALGLPERTRKLTLTVEAFELVTVECEYYPDEIDTALEILTKTYNLVEKE